MIKRTSVLIAICVVLTACAGVAAQSKHAWTNFVPVEGQPELVPAEWVATSEGKFAHSLKIPNPVPKDSGYKRGMSSDEYFQHLCKTEAGEFIYKTVDNVEGFYFMRPPKWPEDEDLMDRYKLEAPEIERVFQAMRPKIEERATLFVSPPWRLYRFVEEPDVTKPPGQGYLRAYGYRANASQMKVEETSVLKSQYALLWRGLRRPNDRQLAIAGSEWIVLDLKTNEVLAVRRNYGRTGRTPNVSDGVWWLNAAACPKFGRPKTLEGIRTQAYDFALRVLKPIQGDQQ